MLIFIWTHSDACNVNQWDQYWDTWITGAWTLSLTVYLNCLFKFNCKHWIIKCLHNCTLSSSFPTVHCVCFSLSFEFWNHKINKSKDASASMDVYLNDLNVIKWTRHLLTLKNQMHPQLYFYFFISHLHAYWFWFCFFLIVARARIPKTSAAAARSCTFKKESHYVYCNSVFDHWVECGP